MKKALASAIVVLAVIFALSAVAAPGHGMVWLNGQTVALIAPPANVASGSGTDPLYHIPNQLPVATYGPGDQNYRGGRWAVNTVTWNEGHAPHELHSAQEVMDAQAAGEITITRNPEQDNLCPLQPGQNQRN